MKFVPTMAFDNREIRYATGREARAPENAATEAATEKAPEAEEGKPSRLRVNEDGDDKRHASWLELLVDLVFYTVIGQIATVLWNDPSPHGILRFCLFFVPIWWSWVGIAFFAARFDFDDLTHRAFVFAQTLAFAGMALSVTIVSAQRGPRGYRAFAVSYVAMRIVLILQYLRAARRVAEARALARRWAAGFGVAALFWTISIFISGPIRIAFWAVGQIIDSLTPIAGGPILARLTPDKKHLPERFGQLVLIVLGETVTLTISSIDPRHVDPAIIIAVALSLVIFWGVWWVYFDNIDERGGAAIEAVSSDGGIAAFQVWLYAHLPLVVGITAGGVGTRFVLSAIDRGPLPAVPRGIVCGSFALALISLLVIQMTRLREEDPPGRYVFILQGISLVLLIAFGIGGAAFPPLTFLALAAFIALSIVSVSIFKKQRRHSRENV